MTEHPNLASAPDVKLADVKWRVQGRPTNGRVQYVPYVDATTVARLLDEWVTPGGWKDDYAPAHGKGLWGLLSVKVGDEWVTKRDVGVPSNMEAEKGLVSDAFKRVASIKWGVARNVYDLPTLWAPCDERANRNGEKVAYPNAQTLPAIIAELTKRGFSDAAAADATTDHDDEECAAPPKPQAGWSSLEEQDAAHEDFRATLAPLDESVQAEMREYRKGRGFPWPMTSDQLDEMCEHLASLLHKPDVPAPVDDPAEKRKERARQIAEENGLPMASDLAGPAKARAALKEAK